jgi:hypothetical protein
MEISRDIILNSFLVETGEGLAHTSSQANLSWPKPRPTQTQFNW